MQYESSAVFGYHMNVDPPFAVNQLCTPDVVHVAWAIGAVVLTVVVKAHHWLVVTHVDERFIEAVRDPDLCSRRGQPSIDEQEPQPRFPRRLSTGVHQCERDFRSTQPSSPGIALGQGKGIAGHDARSARKRVEMSHGVITRQMPGKVERGPHWTGHRDAVDLDDLVRVDSFVANHNSQRRPATAPDHLDGRIRVDPQRAM